jgi:hypothetical protein
VAKIHRFSPQAAGQILLNRAQQVGLPVQMPQVSQGISHLLGVLYQQGIFLAVDDTSPYFLELSQRLAGRTQQTRAPGAPGNGNGAQAPQQYPQYQGQYPAVQPQAGYPAPQGQTPYPNSPPQFQPMQQPVQQMPPATAARFAAQPIMQPYVPQGVPPPAAQFGGMPPVMPHTTNYAPHSVPVAAPVIGGGPVPVAPVLQSGGMPMPPGAGAPRSSSDAPPSMTDMPAPPGAGGSSLDSI